MTIQATYRPHDMYHGSEPPQHVETQARHDELAAQGWTKEYQHQAFPSTRYDEGGVARQVNTPAEAVAAAKAGFTLTEPPVATK